MKIKICGIKTVKAARVAVESGAELVGLVFYPPSPRYLTEEAAGELVAAIQGFERRPGLVGLFVNTPVAEMAGAVARYGLDYLQLSGDETPEIAAEAAKIRPVIKALRVSDSAEAERQAATFGAIDNLTLLLDSHKAGLYGGTGQVGNWQLAASLAERYRLLLAGGLTPENVAEAVRQVRPWGVDVSSGVESAPGQKDLAKIRAFCQAALSIENRLSPNGGKSKIENS